MAEMVGSVVVQEIVNQILSGLIHKYKGKSDAKEHMERLEMAHIKMEAALETSNKWHITDASLLRWQKKLKRAAQECDDTLHKCKQRIQEEEEAEHGINNCSSFPKRIVHVTRSIMLLIPPLFSHDNNDKSSSYLVRRFEWFANGASEFLRFVEFGSTPRQYMFFDPLIRHLLTGKTLVHKMVRGNQHHCLFLLRPFSIAEHGIEARLFFIHRDGTSPEKNFILTLMLQLSESTDVLGIAIKCMQLFTTDHYFKSTAEDAREQLIQLPTQDFSWVPYVDSRHKQHWSKMHSIFTQWFRPNPLCCKQHEHDPCSRNTTTSKLQDAYLEPVIHVYLQRHIKVSNHHKQTTTNEGDTGRTKDFQGVKLGLLFSPHCSAEDLLPPVEDSTVDVINVEQVDTITLPKAVDCLRQSSDTTAFQRLWKSRHGTAYLHAAKTGMTRMRRSTRKGRKGKLLQRVQDPNLITIQVPMEFLNLWVAHAPSRLQGSIMQWIKKGNEMQLALLRHHP